MKQKDSVIRPIAQHYVSGSLTHISSHLNKKKIESASVAKHFILNILSQRSDVNTKMAYSKKPTSIFVFLIE